MRIGMGCQMNKITSEEEIFLGGVNIVGNGAENKGCECDSLIYAIMDALLGAAALGDVKSYFVEKDPDYAKKPALELLKYVGDLLEEEIYVISNIDAAVLSLDLDISSHVDEMRENIAESLHIRVDQVNVKKMQAGIGVAPYEGQIGAQAIVSVDSIENFSYSIDIQETERTCAGCHGCARS